MSKSLKNFITIKVWAIVMEVIRCRADAELVARRRWKRLQPDSFVWPF